MPEFFPRKKDVTTIVVEATIQSSLHVESEPVVFRTVYMPYCPIRYLM